MDISIVIVEPSDKAVIFEAAPPVSEIPPVTIDNFTLLALCNCKSAAAAFISLKDPALCFIFKSSPAPNFNKQSSPNSKELSDLSKTILFEFALVKVTSSLKLDAASTSTPPAKDKTLIQASFVRAVGQIELLFSYFSSRYFFKEKVKASEIIGIIIFVLGVSLLLFSRV